jgi:hypothetical protein
MKYFNGFDNEQNRLCKFFTNKKITKRFSNFIYTFVVVLCCCLKSLHANDIIFLFCHRHNTKVFLIK